MSAATSTMTKTAPLTPAGALARARAVAEVARRNAQEAEDLRELPPESVRALIDSELGMLLVPERWGGYGLDWMTALDCIVQVGKACGSTAWCLAFLIDHNWVLGLYPEAAQRRVYETTPKPMIFTASAPEGKVRSVEGGFILDGEWSWASGSHHCQWGLIGALLTDAGPPKFLNLLVGPGGFKVIDNWRHFGLKGTGSSNVRLSNVFVPVDQVVSWDELRAGTAPGQKINPEPLFRLPLGAAYPLGIMGPMLGIASGALEDFAAFTSTKIGTFTGEKAAEQAPLQGRIGKAAALVSAGEQIIRRNVEVLTHPEISIDDRVRLKRDYLLACELLTEAIDILMNAAGARGGRLDNPIQRAFRDIHAMRQHVLFSFDVTYASAGRILMGMEPDPRDRI